MNIKEAGNLSGVSVRNIRFYEQKGLLSPARNPENDYRDYSDADIETLKQIRVLRMVDMPLEQIKSVLDGSVPLSAAADAHCRTLRTQIRKLETAVRFCGELAREELPDVDELLIRMDAADSEKLLPKDWVSDYAEAAKRVLIPLSLGAVTGIPGAVFGMHWLLFGFLWPPLLFIGAGVCLLYWGLAGYRWTERNHLWQDTLLVHTIPILAWAAQYVFSMQGTLMVPEPVRMIVDAYTMPLIALFLLPLPEAVKYFAAPGVMILSFCAGHFLARQRIEKKKQTL